MVKIYVNQIKRNAIILEDVPSKWRNEVEKMLEV